MVSKYNFDSLTFTSAGISRYNHPPEDAFEASKIFPIYAVADGVTILKNEEGGQRAIIPYPLLPDQEISGARKVADIFCDETIKYLNILYPKISAKDIVAAFLRANQQILKFNLRLNSNFATCGAVAVIKPSKLLATRLSDTELAIINRGEVRFKTPIRDLGYGGLNGGKNSQIGEIETFQVTLQQRDVIIVYTDGFEQYLKLKEFTRLFGKWRNSSLVKKKLNQLSNKLAVTDQVRYGNERTLVAIKYQI